MERYELPSAAEWKARPPSLIKAAEAALAWMRAGAEGPWGTLNLSHHEIADMLDEALTKGTF